MLEQHSGQAVSTMAKTPPIRLRADYFMVLSQHQFLVSLPWLPVSLALVGMWAGDSKKFEYFVRMML